jgi:hypothetical protein
VSTDKYEWTTVNLKYTSVVWKFSSSSYAEVGMYQRLILGWQWDGHNILKSKGHVEEAQCYWCKQLVNQKHWMLICPQVDLVEKRKVLFHHAALYLGRQLPPLQHIGQKVLEWIQQHIYGFRVLLGM